MANSRVRSAMNVWRGCPWLAFKLEDWWPGQPCFPKTGFVIFCAFRTVPLRMFKATSSKPGKEIWVPFFVSRGRCHVIMGVYWKVKVFPLLGKGEQ